MHFRLTHNLPRCLLAGAALYLLLAANVDAAPAPLRVTTWSMQPKVPVQTNEVQESAALLKKLDPDVIILQQIGSWQSCDELVKALRPANYNLVVCSAFREAKTGALSKQQAAILSKTKSYISWSEAWKNPGQAAAMPGGFAFAAVRLGNKNVGFFSVQLGDGDLPSVGDTHSEVQRQRREECVRQLLRQIAAVQNWTANRIEDVVVAGNFNISMDDPQLADEKTLTLLADAGLANAFINVPLDKRITFRGNGQRSDATLDYIFTGNAGVVTSPRIGQAAWSEHYPVTCDLDLNAPKTIPAATPATVPAHAPVSVTRAETPAVKVPEPAVGRPSPALAPALVSISNSDRNEGNLVKPKIEISPRKLSGLVSHEDGVAVSKPTAFLPLSLKYNAWWLAGGASGGLLLLILVWRLARRSRTQPANGTLLAMKVEAGTSISLPTDAERIVITHRSDDTAGSASNGPTIVHIETPGSSHTQSQAWQRRAEEAERRAQQATAVMRAGLIPHLSRWLKEKLVQKLVLDRVQLMEVQRAAALKMLAVDERLSKIESQIQQRNQDYEQRIDDLMKELAVAKEENRELIQAKIALVKAEMERERAKKEKQF